MFAEMICRILRAFMVVSCCWSTAYAEVGNGYLSKTNPLYEHVLKGAFLPAGKTARTCESPVDCFSYAAFKSAIEEHYGRRVTEFSIHLQYDFLFSQVGDIVSQAHDEIVAADDYLRFSYTGYNVGWGGYDGDVTLDFQVRYLTTYDQEQYVSQRVNEIIGQITAPTMNEEQKEKEIHDWIVTHVEYDTTDQTDPVRYTAYGALFFGRAVCQGYALLGFGMLQKAGLGVRIVPGYGNGEDHAWNMVRICGNWYHLDITWDDPISSDQKPGLVYYNYFNKSDDDMRRDHTWESAGYPVASTLYVPGICSGETTLLTWETSKSAAMAIAQREERIILLIAGQTSCGNTTYVLNTVIQSIWPEIKGLLREHFIVWYCEVDSSTEWHPYASGLGSFPLPLICLIDPVHGDEYLDRSTGIQTPEEFYARIREMVPTTVPITPQEQLEAVTFLPEEYVLSPCVPNPFNPSTTIRYQLSEPGEVRLTIYDLLGQKVRVLVSEPQPAGWYRMSWDGRDEAGRLVSSGVVLYRLAVGSDFVQARKALLLR
jgi:hypothetical protein